MSTNEQAEDTHECGGAGRSNTRSAGANSQLLPRWNDGGSATQRRDELFNSQQPINRTSTRPESNSHKCADSRLLVPPLLSWAPKSITSVRREHLYSAKRISHRRWPRNSALRAMAVGSGPSAENMSRRGGVGLDAGEYRSLGMLDQNAPDIASARWSNQLIEAQASPNRPSIMVCFKMKPEEDDPVKTSTGEAQRGSWQSSATAFAAV